jgi:hypothetical protein
MTLLRLYRLALALMTVALVAVSLVCVREHQEKVAQREATVAQLPSSAAELQQWRDVGAAIEMDTIRTRHRLLHDRGIVYDYRMDSVQGTPSSLANAYRALQKTEWEEDPRSKEKDVKGHPIWDGPLLVVEHFPF